MVYPSLGHGPTRRSRTEFGHPAHRGFARAIDAEDVVVRFRSLPAPVRGTLLTDAVSAAVAPIPERPVYVLENDAVLYAAPFLRRRHPAATILHLAASDRLLQHSFAPRPDDARAGALVRRLNGRVDTALLQRILGRCCDGAIAVSRFARDRIHSAIDPTLPVRVVEPYVQPAVYDALSGVDPDLSGTVAVVVGEWRDHKGVDLLVEAWPRVRHDHPDAELRVVGAGYPSEYADTLGVTLRGFVESLETELAAASLYVHPARVEAFGVSVVEAMRAGLPAIVTGTTGARSAVSAVDDSLVVPPTPSALAGAVSRYFDAPVERRRALSRACRDRSAAFSEAAKTRRFRERFALLLEDARRERSRPGH